MKLGFWRRLHCRLLAHSAPDFWECFPPVDRQGTWLCQVYRTGIAFSTLALQFTHTGSIWDAYIRTRGAAVRMDWTTPIHPDDEVGVKW